MYACHRFYLTVMLEVKQSIKILNKRDGNANTCSSIFILFSAICHKNVEESLANKTTHRDAWEK